MAESTQASISDADRLRQEVFERLNTGGQVLNAQELRNSVYSGTFNSLLIELAGNALFDDIWDIPRYDDHYDRKTGQIGSTLAQNPYFRRMIDCEIVLRFFAFREGTQIKGSVKVILDRCMKGHKDLPPPDVDALRNDFLNALRIAHRVFGNHTFRIQKPEGKWNLSQPLYDAVMIGVHCLRERESELYNARKRIIRALERALKVESTYEIVVGKPNTAKSVKERIKLIQAIMKGALQ